MSNPLDYPFLDYKGIMSALGPVCKKESAYRIISELTQETDEKGELLIDPARMPPINKKMVPTEIFCKRYGIKRTRKKDAS